MFLRTEVTMRVFWRGVIAGFVIAAVIFSVVAGGVQVRNREKEKTKYVELLQEIETLREDVNNFSADELLDLPGVRRAADGASAGFDRKRDKALERFRSGLAD